MPIDEFVLNYIAVRMYWRLQRDGAISKRWEKHTTIRYIEVLAKQVVNDSEDFIRIAERMQRHN